MKKTQNTSIDSPRLTQALELVKRIALECADDLIGDKICWHGREAVASVLLENAVSNMADNLHDDPSQYIEIVEDVLGGKP